jgi:hypothetical protein
MRKVTDKPAFQGDLMSRRIGTLPTKVTPSAAENGVHILAHSETGHHHVIEADAATRFIDDTNAFIAYLKVASETEIKHLRGFDTHEALTLTPGIYEVRQQREYFPEGFRPAAD